MLRLRSFYTSTSDSLFNQLRVADGVLYNQIREQKTLPRVSKDSSIEMKKYSPFGHKQKGYGEWMVARLDDILNCGR